MSEDTGDKLVELDDHRPHFTIYTSDGNTHVVPVSLIQDWAEGRQEIDDGEEWKPVVRAIVSEWLNTILGG